MLALNVGIGGASGILGKREAKSHQMIDDSMCSSELSSSAKNEYGFETDSNEVHHWGCTPHVGLLHEGLKMDLDDWRDLIFDIANCSITELEDPSSPVFKSTKPFNGVSISITNAHGDSKGVTVSVEGSGGKLSSFNIPGINLCELQKEMRETVTDHVNWYPEKSMVTTVVALDDLASGLADFNKVDSFSEVRIKAFNQNQLILYNALEKIFAEGSLIVDLSNNVQITATVEGDKIILAMEGHRVSVDMNVVNSLVAKNTGNTENAEHDIAKTTSISQENPYSKERNSETYHRIYGQISERYQHFQQEIEIGFKDKPGLTGDIADITKKDLIGVLMHIKDNEDLLTVCQKNSAKSPFFDKLYLMKDPVQKWNLRLHHYNARGSGLGGEDSPHYHRWTLATASLAGGYINVNYAESEVTQESNTDHIYNKYLLPATDAQTSTQDREIKFLEKRVMAPVKKEIYAEGRLNHFPFTEPHSVNTVPEYFGSTLTLAHTGESVTDTSYAFEKNELQAIPQLRYTDNDEFRGKLEQEITFLQILDLKDELQTFLKQKSLSGKTLTPHEIDHLRDSHEANYVETSLLSALAIYDMENENEISHREFDPDTVAFLDAKLAHMGKDALKKIIVFNQEDLWDQRFSVSVKPESELGQLLASSK